ncbi:MAG TPA: ribonuclease P protein component [Clostridia bacterium]|nr:ribonuclease P protein component [Clostridia bacterium]
MQKIYRLTLNGSFKYIYRNGANISSKLLIFYKVPAHNLKVGITVGKKVGNSVTRSLVKRRISESFRLLIPRISTKYNYVIVAKALCANAGYDEINADLISLLEKGGVLEINKDEKGV